MVTNGTEQASRNFKSWVEAFVVNTENLPSPEMFRKWVAIATVGCALERRCWMVSDYGELYPNLYILLVGPPAAGKTVAIDAARVLINKVEHIHMAPTNVTHASLLDDLAKTSGAFMKGDTSVTYHSMQVFSREFGVLLPEYDTKVLNHLINFYDCDNDFQESRRGREVKILAIPNSQLNILAATTPSYLGDFFPQAAWDQGFASRLLLIYCEKRELRPIWKDLDEITDAEMERLKVAAALQDQLAADLVHIGALTGRFRWAKPAAQAFQAWWFAGCPPQPDHPKLQFYAGRRHTMCMKLCMIASAARNDEMVIELQDYQTALGWLLEAEMFIPDIFKSMSGGPDANAIDNTWAYIWEVYAKSKTPVNEQLIYAFLVNRTNATSTSVSKVLETMERAGLIEKAGYAGTRTLYIPCVR